MSMFIKITKAPLCTLLTASVLAVTTPSPSSLAVTKPATTNSSTKRAAQAATVDPKNTSVYKILRNNKLIDQNLLKKVVQKTRFLGQVLWLFDYEDALSAKRRDEQNQLTDDLNSYRAGQTSVTIKDGIKLALRAAGLPAENENVTALFKVLQEAELIPPKKTISSSFSYQVAVNILQKAYDLRSERFKAVKHKQLPVERFISVEKPKVSVDDENAPEGYEAFLAEWAGVYNMFVKNKSTGTTYRVSNVKSSDIAGGAWAGERLLYFKDGGGDECYHIYSSSFGGYQERDLTPRIGKSFSYVGLMEKDKRIVVKTYNKSLHEFIFYKIDIENDDWEEFEYSQGPWQYTSLTIPGDKESYLKVTQEFNNGENARVYMVNKKTFDEELIFELTGGKQFIPLFVSDDGTSLLGLSNQKTNMLCPVELDLYSGNLEVLYKDPNKYDVLDYVAGRPGPIEIFDGSIIIQYYAQKFVSFAMDADVQSLLNKVKSRLGCQELMVTGLASDHSSITVQEVTPLLNGNVYRYTAATGRLVCQTKNRTPNKTEEALQLHSRPISFISRDGEKIEGYLTLPAGKAPESLPTIVLVHGGPWSRDKWFCNGEARFWQNRGYAVLQVNYRSSTGYGRRFLRLGDHQWGKKVQKDIIDGTKWLIKKGVADKNRICISGASYGGFSALWGLAFEPQLYACGVSLCGFSNILNFLQIPDSWLAYRARLYAHVGNPSVVSKALKSVSPISHLEKIEKPLFVGQGANDPRVKRAESDRVVRALRQNGQTVRYIVRENEGHGFRKKQNILDFYSRVEKFLNRYLTPAKITKL